MENSNIISINVVCMHLSLAHAYTFKKTQINGNGLVDVAVVSTIASTLRWLSVKLLVRKFGMRAGENLIRFLMKK